MFSADGGQFQWRLVRQQAGFLPLDGAALVQLQQAAVGVGLGLGQAAEGVVSAEQLVAQHLDAVLHMALLVAAKAVGHVDLVPIVHRHFDEVGIPYPSDHQENLAFLLGLWMLLTTCEHELIHGEPPLVLSGFLAGYFQTLSAIQGV